MLKREEVCTNNSSSGCGAEWAVQESWQATKSSHSVRLNICLLADDIKIHKEATVLHLSNHMQCWHIIIIILSEDTFLASGRKQQKLKGRRLLDRRGFCSFMRAQVENSGQLAQWQLQRQPYGHLFSLFLTHTHKIWQPQPQTPLAKCSFPITVSPTEEIAVARLAS